MTEKGFSRCYESWAGVFPLWGNRFQEKCRFPDRRCVSRVRLFFPPEAEEAGANELLTGKREGLVPGARVLYHKNRHVFGMGKVLGQTVLTAPAGADKTLKQGVHPAGGKAFSTQAVMWPRQYRRIINNQLKKKMIVFTEEKKFSREDVQELFLSVGWISGQYPGRLYKALMNSSTVVTAWDGDRLAGLVRVLDDSEMVAYMHYVLVHPAYQGRGIAGKWWKWSRRNTGTTCILKSCRRRAETPLFMRSTASGLWRTA